MPSKFIEVRIPPGFEPGFKMWTRPLWYEELARYFHTNINEAADMLGMCPSAIKRICRRQGLHRWPHRKIHSIERRIASLEQQLETEGAGMDIEARRAVYKSIMEAVSEKVISSCNLSTCNSRPSLDDEDLESIDYAERNAPLPAIHTYPPYDSHPVGGPVASLNNYSKPSTPAQPATPGEHYYPPAGYSETLLPHFSLEGGVPFPPMMGAAVATPPRKLPPSPPSLPQSCRPSILSFFNPAMLQSRHSSILPFFNTAIPQ